MLSFFDCNVMVGPASHRPEYQLWRPEDITRQLAEAGIADALAMDVRALEYHPEEGNRSILDIYRENPGLHPVWAVLPEGCGEMPGGKALGEAMKANGVRMARAFPSPLRHKFSMGGWCAGGLLRTLAEAGVPLMLDAADIQPDDLHRLLCENPGLNVILANLTYRMDRVLFPLLEQCGNLYLETSGLKGFLSIETLCMRFGCGRLVFGSGMPQGSAGAAVAIVEMSDISDAEKRQIARENLVGLLPPE